MRATLTAENQVNLKYKYEIYYEILFSQTCRVGKYSLKSAPMSRIEYRGNNPKPIQNLLLIIAFLIGSALILLPLVWISSECSADLGPNAAQAALAFGFIIMFLLVVLGIGGWYLIDRAISRRRSIFSTDNPQPIALFLMLLLGYELVDEAEHVFTQEKETVVQDRSSVKTMRKKPRPGRKPTFPLERWLPIAQKWENRDPVVDAFTLGELIAEHLGTNADGSPIMSEQSYYSMWRDLAMAELEKREAQKKAKRSGAGIGKEADQGI